MDLMLLLALPPATGLLCRLLSRQSWIEGLSAAGASATLLAGLVLAARVFTGGPVAALGDLLYVDALGALLITVIVIVGFLGALYSVGYLRRDIEHGKVPANQLGWYYMGLHGFVWSMLVAGVVNNLGLLWVAIEATTLVSALLVGFYRSRAALEAAWKYLILCTVGITFALFGVLLTYYASARSLGEEAGLTWTVLVQHSGQLDPGLMKLAFVFILVGFGTKAGFAPLHNWLPDAHSQAPSPVSALLSGVLLKVGLYGVIRFYLITTGAVSPEFASNLLLAFGLLSVVVAVPFILVQTDLKRLLAYSSVEHIGLIATAVAIGGPLGLYAGMLHLFNHAMAKALLFFVAGNLSQRYGTTQMSRIHNALQAMPATGMLLLLGSFAITGVPPFAIFMSEFGIVGAGFARGNPAVAMVVIAALILVFAGVFRRTLEMAFGRPASHLAPVTVGPLGSATLVVPTALVLLFGLYIPPPINEAVQQVVSIFGGGRP